MNDALLQATTISHANAILAPAPAATHGPALEPVAAVGAIRRPRRAAAQRDYECE